MNEIDKHVEAHSFSDFRLGSYPEFVRKILLVKIACARANAKAGDLSNDTAAAIEQAAFRLIEKFRPELYPVDLLQGGGGIALNHNINQVLALESGECGILADDCNHSQSTADVIATAYRLWLADLSEVLLEQVQKMRDRFFQLAEKFQTIETISRTCLQDALPVSLAVKFIGYSQVVENRLSTLKNAATAFQCVTLGGTVIGTGAGASESYRKLVLGELNDLLGKTLVESKTAYAIIQSSEDLGQYSHQVNLLAENLIKICSDLRWLSSGPQGGLGEITIPAVVSGSSFFKNKANPTVIETLQQACFQVIGHGRTVSACLEHAELDLNTFEFQAGFNLAQSISFLSRAIENINCFVLEGLAANEKRCQSLVQMSFGQKKVEL